MKKSFWLWSAVFLWIWSMVGSWIFVLLWEAGSIAWNLVWVSFLLGWVVALLSWYSLSKLAVAFPNRWWIIEYLVQCYWKWFFSWTISVLFYLSALVALSMVAKTFWTYLSVLLWLNWKVWVNIFSVWVIILFLWINLAWSKLMAKSENIIVLIKLSILILFTIIISFFIKPEYLTHIDKNIKYLDIFYAIWLTFFAYEWFRVITNTAEDIENPSKNLPKAMMIAISLVIILYFFITIAVFWNLTLDEIVKTKDYALAEASKPVLWTIWFSIMAIAALISTSSSINANLYAVANVSYDMAINWELPKKYTYWIFHSNLWLLISWLIIIIFILFFDLSEIASIWALSMLFIHLIVHIGHLFVIKKTKASKILLYLAIFTISLVIYFAYNYTATKINNLWYMIFSLILFSFILEVFLRLKFNRIVWK